MRTCRAIKRKLVELYYKDLPLEEERDLKCHLAQCPRCQRAFERLERSLKLVNRIKDEPPQEFWEGYLPSLWEKIRRRERRKPKIALSLNWGLAKVALSILLVIGVGTVLLQRGAIFERTDLVEELLLMEELDELSGEETGGVEELLGEIDPLEIDIGEELDLFM